MGAGGARAGGARRGNTALCAPGEQACSVWSGVMWSCLGGRKGSVIIILKLPGDSQQQGTMCPGEGSETHSAVTMGTCGDTWASLAERARQGPGPVHPASQNVASDRSPCRHPHPGPNDSHWQRLVPRGLCAPIASHWAGCQAGHLHAAPGSQRTGDGHAWDSPGQTGLQVLEVTPQAGLGGEERPCVHWSRSSG